MKRCTICRHKKQLSEFYCTPQNRGSRPAQPCKDCKSACVRLRRRNNPAVREHDRVRDKRPDRRATMRALAERWDRQNPEGYRARYTLKNAIRDGIISRGPCIGCGSTDRVCGIHPDYSKPLDVFWRCALCHRRALAAKDAPNWRKRYADKAAALNALRLGVPHGTTLIIIDTFNSKERRA